MVPPFATSAHVGTIRGSSKDPVNESPPEIATLACRTAFFAVWPFGTAWKSETGFEFGDGWRHPTRRVATKRRTAGGCLMALVPFFPAPANHLGPATGRAGSSASARRAAIRAGRV